MLNVIESIAVIISSFTVVVGVVIAIMQLRKMQSGNNLQQKSFLADHERRKKQSTIEFTYQVLEERIKATKSINKAFPNKEVVNVNSRAYTENLEDVRGAISRYLNLMERISVGINIGVYDLDTFMRITGVATINFYKRIEPIILEKRKVANRSSLYCDFEKLVKDMMNAYQKDAPLIQNDNASIRYS